MIPYTVKVEVTLTGLLCENENHAIDHGYEVVDAALTAHLSSSLFDPDSDSGFVANTTSAERS